MGRLEDGALDAVNSAPVPDEDNLEPEVKLFLRHPLFILAGDVAAVFVLPCIHAVHQGKQLAKGVPVYLVCCTELEYRLASLNLA